MSSSTDSSHGLELRSLATAHQQRKQCLYHLCFKSKLFQQMAEFLKVLGENLNFPSEFRPCTFVFGMCSIYEALVERCSLLLKGRNPSSIGPGWDDVWLECYLSRTIGKKCHHQASKHGVKTNTSPVKMTIRRLIDILARKATL